MGIFAQSCVFLHAMELTLLMLSIYNIKPKFQELLRPVLTFLHRQHVTANQITLASMAVSLLIGIGFWYADQFPLLFLCLPIGLFVRMALNALDGMMARLYLQQSKLGEVLNELGDVLSDLFIFFPLVKYESQSLYLVLLFICFSIFNEYAGILGKAVSGMRRYEGPMGKSDRAFVIGLYGLLRFLNIWPAYLSPYFFGLLILLVTLSTLIRVRKIIE